MRPSIAQLAERRTVEWTRAVILRSLVRFRLEGGARCFCGSAADSLLQAQVGHSRAVVATSTCARFPRCASTCPAAPSGSPRCSCLAAQARHIPRPFHFYSHPPLPLRLRLRLPLPLALQRAGSATTALLTVDRCPWGRRRGRGGGVGAERRPESCSRPSCGKETPGSGCVVGAHHGEDSRWASGPLKPRGCPAAVLP